ncbi:MAG TPA: uroporphyrinogen decarboxylase family protein [Armatimonadota bacterium]|jgi:uroporphyrinogen decarboxylase
MTKRERYLAFANFEPVDRIPRHASYVDDLRQRMEAYVGQDPYGYFDMDTGGGAGLTAPEGFTRPDYSVYHQEWLGNESFSIDGNGCGHLNHGFYHFTEYISPLRNATRFEEIEAYPIVSNAGWSDARLRQAAEEAHAAGTFANVFVGHMYENAWQVRGYEAFLMDLLTQREWAESILDRYCDNNLRVAEAAARAGYDMISTGDDVASQQALMFQPELWREVMKPRWAKVIAAARAIKPDIHVWYHSDGNIWEILDDLIEIGITILNPVQPECLNPFEVRKRCGKRLAFDGCVGTQSTFPFGTPLEMRQVVHELVEGLDGRQGGLMLSPTHVLEPEVPPANIVEFFDEIERIALEWRKEE